MVSMKQTKVLFTGKQNYVWRRGIDFRYPIDHTAQPNRTQQTLVFFLRTGHCRLKAHLHKLRALPPVNPTLRMPIISRTLNTSHKPKTLFIVSESLNLDLEKKKRECVKHDFLPKMRFMETICLLV